MRETKQKNSIPTFYLQIQIGIHIFVGLLGFWGNVYHMHAQMS